MADIPIEELVVDLYPTSTLDKGGQDYAYKVNLIARSDDKGRIEDQKILERFENQNGKVTLDLYEEFCEATRLNLYVCDVRTTEFSLVKEVDMNRPSIVLLRQVKGTEVIFRLSYGVYFKRSSTDEKRKLSPYWYIVRKQDNVRLCILFKYMNANAVNNKGQLVKTQKWSKDIVYLFHQFWNKDGIYSTVYFEPAGENYFEHVSEYIQSVIGGDDVTNDVKSIWKTLSSTSHQLKAKVANVMNVTKDGLKKLDPLKPKNSEEAFRFAAAFGVTDVMEYTFNPGSSFKHVVINHLEHITCFCVRDENSLRYLRVNGMALGNVELKNDHIVDIGSVDDISMPPDWSLLYQKPNGSSARRIDTYPEQVNPSVTLKDGVDLPLRQSQPNVLQEKQQGQKQTDTKDEKQPSDRDDDIVVSGRGRKGRILEDEEIIIPEQHQPMSVIPSSRRSTRQNPVAVDPANLVPQQQQKMATRNTRSRVSTQIQAPSGSLQSQVADVSQEQKQIQQPAPKIDNGDKTETITLQPRDQSRDNTRMYYSNDECAPRPFKDDLVLDVNTGTLVGFQLREYLRSLLLDNLDIHTFYHRSWYGLSVSNEYDWPTTMYTFSSNKQITLSGSRKNNWEQHSVILVTHSYDAQGKHVFTIRRPVDPVPNARYLVVLRAGTVRNSDGDSQAQCEDYILCNVRWKPTLPYDLQTTIAYDADVERSGIGSWSTSLKASDDVLSYIYGRVLVLTQAAKATRPVNIDNSCFLHSAFEVLKFTGQTLQKNNDILNHLNLYFIYQVYRDTNNLKACMEYFKEFYGISTVPTLSYGSVLATFSMRRDIVLDPNNLLYFISPHEAYNKNDVPIAMKSAKWICRVFDEGVGTTTDPNNSNITLQVQHTLPAVKWSDWKAKLGDGKSVIKAGIRFINMGHFTFLTARKERDDLNDKQYDWEPNEKGEISITAFVVDNTNKSIQDMDDLTRTWTNAFGALPEPKILERIPKTGAKTGEKPVKSVKFDSKNEYKSASKQQSVQSVAVDLTATTTDPSNTTNAADPSTVAPVVDQPSMQPSAPARVKRQTQLQRLLQEAAIITGNNLLVEAQPEQPKQLASQVQPASQVDEPLLGEDQQQRDEQVADENEVKEEEIKVSARKESILKGLYSWRKLVPADYRNAPSYTWYDASRHVKPLGCYSHPTIMRAVFDYNHNGDYFRRIDSSTEGLVDYYQKPRLADMLLLAFRMALASKSRYFGIENGTIIRVSDGLDLMQAAPLEMCQACKKQCTSGIPCGGQCIVNGVCTQKPPHTACYNEDHRDRLAFKAGGRDTAYIYEIPSFILDTWDPELQSHSGDAFVLPEAGRYTYGDPDLTTGWKCADPTALPYNFALSKSQQFVTSYFDPLQPHKSILLYKSAGAGKTCDMVSIMGRYFMYGYDAIWITRQAIKSEPPNAIFRDACMEHLRKDFVDNPNVKDVVFNRGITMFGKSSDEKQAIDPQVDKLHFIQNAQTHVLKGSYGYDYMDDRESNIKRDPDPIIRGRMKSDPFYIKLTNQDIITYNDMVTELLRTDQEGKTRFQRSLDSGKKYIIIMDEAHNLNNDDPMEFGKLNMQTDRLDYSVWIDGKEIKYTRGELIPGASGRLHGRDILLAFVSALMQTNRGRLVMATATPMINSVLDACVILNFMEPNTQRRLPTDHDSWFDSSGEVNKQNKTKFKNILDGRVSCFLSTLDPSYFARKVFHKFVVVPATANQTAKFRETINTYQQETKELRKKEGDNAKARTNQAGRPVKAITVVKEKTGKEGRDRRDKEVRDRRTMSALELSQEYNEALILWNEVTSGTTSIKQNNLDDFNETLVKDDDGHYTMMTYAQYLEKFTRPQSAVFKDMWQNMYNYSIVDSLSPTYVQRIPAVTQENKRMKRLYDEARIMYERDMVRFTTKGNQRNRTFKKWLEDKPEYVVLKGYMTSSSDAFQPKEDFITYEKITVAAGLRGHGKEETRVMKQSILKKYRKEIAPKVDAMIQEILKAPNRDRHLVFTNTAGTTGDDRNWGSLVLAGLFKVDDNFHVFSAQELRTLANMDNQNQTMKEIGEYARKLCGTKTGVMFMSVTSFKTGEAAFEFSPKNQAFVQKLFNDDKNADFLRVMILDRKFSEGVSFFNIHWQHHLDTPFSRYALEQSTARGVRFCKSNNLPFYKGVGGFCRILFYDLSFYLNDTDTEPILVKDAVLSLADPQWLKEQHSVDEFDQLLQLNAVDRDFNRAINEFVSAPLEGEIVRVYHSKDTRLSTGSSSYPFRIYDIQTKITTMDEQTETYVFMVDGQNVLNHPNYLTDPSYQQNLLRLNNNIVAGSKVEFYLPYAVTMAQQVLNIGNYIDELPNVISRYKERESTLRHEQILPFGLEYKNADLWSERDKRIQHSNRFPLIGQVRDLVNVPYEHLVGQFRQSFTLALAGFTAISLDPLFDGHQTVRFSTSPLRWACARYNSVGDARLDDQVVIFGQQLALFNPDTRAEDKQTAEGEEEPFFLTYQRQVGTMKHRFVSGRTQDTFPLDQLFSTDRKQRYLVVLLELTAKSCEDFVKTRVSNAEYNLLICDRIDKRIERFDPSGDAQVKYESKQLNILLSQIADRMKFEYICLNDTPFQEDVEVPQVVYSILYLHMRVLYGLQDDAFRFNRKLLRYLSHDLISGNLRQYFHLYTEQVLQSGIHLRDNWKYYHRQKSIEENMKRFLNGIQEDEAITLINYRPNGNTQLPPPPNQIPSLSTPPTPTEGPGGQFAGLKVKVPGLLDKIWFSRIPPPNLKSQSTRQKLLQQYVNSESLEKDGTEDAEKIYAQIVYVVNEGPKLLRRLGMSSVAQEWNEPHFWGRPSLKALMTSFQGILNKRKRKEGLPVVSELTPLDWFHLYPVEVYRLMVAMDRWRSGQPRVQRATDAVPALNHNLYVHEDDSPDGKYVLDFIREPQMIDTFKEALNSQPVLQPLYTKAQRSVHNQWRYHVKVVPESITLDEIIESYPRYLRPVVEKWKQNTEITYLVTSDKKNDLIQDPFALYERDKQRRNQMATWKRVDGDSPLWSPGQRDSLKSSSASRQNMEPVQVIQLRSGRKVDGKAAPVPPPPPPATVAVQPAAGEAAVQPAPGTVAAPGSMTTEGRPVGHGPPGTQTKGNKKGKKEAESKTDKTKSKQKRKTFAATEGKGEDEGNGEDEDEDSEFEDDGDEDSEYDSKDNDSVKGELPPSYKTFKNSLAALKSHMPSKKILDANTWFNEYFTLKTQSSKKDRKEKLITIWPVLANIRHTAQERLKKEPRTKNNQVYKRLDRTKTEFQNFKLAVDQIENKLRHGVMGNDGKMKKIPDWEFPKVELTILKKVSKDKSSKTK